GQSPSTEEHLLPPEASQRDGLPEAGPEGSPKLNLDAHLRIQVRAVRTRAGGAPIDVRPTPQGLLQLHGAATEDDLPRRLHLQGKRLLHDRLQGLEQARREW